MRPTQVELEKRLKWVMVVTTLMAMVLLRSFGNLMLSVFFGLFVVVFPFWLESQVRYKLIPYLDSLNVSEKHFSEDFSIGFRIAIWVFVGIILSAIWTVLVPLIFALPLWVGWLARGLFGLERLSWGYWQWGWMVTFLVQYLISFMFGWFNNEYDSFEERFDYP